MTNDTQYIATFLRKVKVIITDRHSIKQEQKCEMYKIVLGSGDSTSETNYLMWLAQDGVIGYTRCDEYGVPEYLAESINTTYPTIEAHLRGVGWQVTKGPKTIHLVTSPCGV